MSQAMNWRHIKEQAEYQELRYIVLAGDDKVIDKVDDLHYAQKLCDETVDGRVFDLYEDRIIY